MTEDEALIDLVTPDHVSIKRAARMLGVSYTRTRQYIEEERLHTVPLGNMLMIPKEDVFNFRRHAAGRTHQKPRVWDFYRNIELLASSTKVQILPGKKDAFKAKLEALLREDKHLITGTTHRFIWEDEDSPSTVYIWFIWKENEAPDAATHERDLEAFEAEFADVLDWQHAEPHQLKGLLYTR